MQSHPRFWLAPTGRRRPDRRHDRNQALLDLILGFLFAAPVLWFFLSQMGLL